MDDIEKAEDKTIADASGHYTQTPWKKSGASANFVEATRTFKTHPTSGLTLQALAELCDDLKERNEELLAAVSEHEYGAHQAQKRENELLRKVVELLEARRYP